jgi:hypothetical protein
MTRIKFCATIAIVFLGISLASQASIANQVTSNCPDVSGSWQRQNGDVISIRQTSCTLVSASLIGNIDHEIKGEWDKQGFFEYVVVRTNKNTNCVTEMYGRLYSTGRRQIVTQIYGTDGRCELPIEFKERSAWARRSN